jgi:hypothetical protein
MEINFFENLVYGIFGSPIIFVICMLAMFGWYAMKYDFSKSIFVTFLIIFGMAFYFLIGMWVLMVVLIIVLVTYTKEIINLFRDR